MINVVISGSEPMACEYSTVLQAMHIPFTVISSMLGRYEQTSSSGSM